MPFPSPFHPRTDALCESQEWRNWAGYLAAATYVPSHEREYYAIRNAAAMIDVSPLFKYEVSGPDALRLVNRVMTRDIARCAVGQVMYSPWCDDRGKVIDDGTIARLGENRFRITAAEPNLAWFQDCGVGLNAQVRDVSEEVATLALQGPNARRILLKVVNGGDLEGLRYYRLSQGNLGGIPLTISRTGYTGDLGYELWIDPQFALKVWDKLLEEGEGFGITPVGMVALDIVRIEAGLVMLQVDYISARKALIDEQKSSPFELGLGWTVDLGKKYSIGWKALLDEKRQGSQWKLVGVEVDWTSLEREFGWVNLVPQVVGRASRSAVPVYRNDWQIGHVSSHTFSPILKKYIGIATIESRYAEFGSPVEVEITVEYARRKARATIVKLPFFDPPRKRA